MTERHRNRAGQLLAVDDLVASVVQALRETNELDNTYIFFTSDNGFLEGQHRFTDGKHAAYEEAIRVPLVVAGPGLRGGEVREQIVSNIDVTATIVELAGAIPGRPQDGKSMMPILADEAAPWRTMQVIQGAD